MRVILYATFSSYVSSEKLITLQTIEDLYCLL